MQVSVLSAGPRGARRGTGGGASGEAEAGVGAPGLPRCPGAHTAGDGLRPCPSCSVQPHAHIGCQLLMAWPEAGLRGLRIWALSSAFLPREPPSLGCVLFLSLLLPLADISETGIRACV